MAGDRTREQVIALAQREAFAPYRWHDLSPDEQAGAIDRAERVPDAVRLVIEHQYGERTAPVLVPAIKAMGRCQPSVPKARCPALRLLAEWVS